MNNWQTIIILKRIEGDDDHSEPREEEGQTSVTDGNNNEEEGADREEEGQTIVTEGNNNEEEDVEGEEEGQTMDTDGNNDEEEDAEGERVHRYNTRLCTNLTGPFDFDQMAS
jgi:hypothetical protein